MATRGTWESLSPTHRGRLSRNGITKTAYESGVSLKAARGHASTPEHGVREALKNPTKYKKYLNKKLKIVGGPTAATMHDKAYRSISRLKSYKYYDDETVRANVYGGNTSESGDVPGMSYAHADWTSTATIQEIRSMAADQYKGNPWYYH
jgi:hypothetical protein